MEKMDFKALREAKGFTQDQIAEAVGVSEGTVELWEDGMRLPRAEDVLRLCSLFDLCVEKILHSLPKWVEKHGEEWVCMQNCSNCPNKGTIERINEQKEKSPGEGLDFDVESVITVLGHIKECLENPEKRVDDFVYDWCKQNPDKPEAEKIVREVYSRDIGYAISLLAQLN